MTNVEFVEETANIEKFFNKELSEFERVVWFKEFKNTSIERYRQVINQVYRNCKFMPKLADMVSINNELKTTTIPTEVTKEECKKCNGNGFIIYKKIIGDGNNKKAYDFVARCDCSNGLDYAYDERNMSSKGKYYIPTISEINLR